MTHALVFWFTGLSGSGKTSIAEAAKRALVDKGFSVLVLDGDEIRERLHQNFGFTEQDIKENNRLIAELCVEKSRDCDVILVPIISPYAVSRQNARTVIGEGFYEVYFSAGLETVVKRDTKGLYEKARRCEIDNLIGYSPGSRYEAPGNPDYEINTALGSLEEQSHDFVRFILSQLHRVSAN